MTADTKNLIDAAGRLIDEHLNSIPPDDRMAIVTAMADGAHLALVIVAPTDPAAEPWRVRVSLVEGSHELPLNSVPLH
jgi:hypothetical protein